MPDPAIPLLGIELIEILLYIHQKTSTRIFIEILFIIAQNLKQPTSLH